MSARKLLLAWLALSLFVSTSRAGNEQETQARKNALELAGAFSNDGYKIRDGHWVGPLKPRERQLLAVNLYAGNQYWFSIGASDSAKSVGVEVFDETGRKMATEPYSAEAKAAAGFSPSTSGQYFVAITLLEGEPSICCLVYSYK